MSYPNRQRQSQGSGMFSASSQSQGSYTQGGYTQGGYTNSGSSQQTPYGGSQGYTAGYTTQGGTLDTSGRTSTQFSYETGTYADKIFPTDSRRGSSFSDSSRQGSHFDSSSRRGNDTYSVNSKLSYGTARNRPPPDSMSQVSGSHSQPTQYNDSASVCPSIGTTVAGGGRGR